MAETPAETTRPAGRARMEPPDISEKGGVKDGRPQRSDERLFMQLLAFGDCDDARAVTGHLAGAADAVVVYEDLNDPHGIAVADGQPGSEHVHRARAAASARPVRWQACR